jgi:hypothetical protein
MSANTPFDAERHLDAMAPAVGLTITAEQRPVVLQFLTIAERMAHIVASCPLDDAELSLAPVFRPGARGSETA